MRTRVAMKKLLNLIRKRNSPNGRLVFGAGVISVSVGDDYGY